MVFTMLLMIRLLAAHQQDQITLEQFGVQGNGKDETGQILQALSYAKEHKLSVVLQDKTYKLSPSSTIDITGIVSIEGKGTFDLSSTGPNAGYKSMTHIFRVKGEKQLIDQQLNVLHGTSILNIKKGLDIKAGDILFLTSAEPLPNQRRAYNCKGQRAIAKRYDPRSGILSIFDTIYLDIAAGCLWKNSVVPAFKIGPDVQFVTSMMNFVGCFEIIYSDANISGSFENFALAAISLRSSKGYFEKVRSQLPVTFNNGYSIGISIADMSDGFVKDCNLSGGRHAVSGTGGGLWRKSESGGPDEPAGYPSTYILDGGTYTGSKNVNGISEDNGTLDSHGNVYKMVIRNCRVYGGLNLGADYAFINNVDVFTDTKRAFNFGSDVKPGSDWGHYYVQNVRITVDSLSRKSVMQMKADINVLVLDDIRFSGVDKNTLLADFRYPGPKLLNLHNMQGISQRSIPRFLLNKNTVLEISQSPAISNSQIKRF